MHRAVKPWEYQVLSWSLSSYMDYYTSPLVGFSTFNFSTSNLFSTYCYYDLPKIHVDPFPKTQPALSSPVELNFLFVDMTFKVFPADHFCFISNQVSPHSPCWTTLTSLIMPCTSVVSPLQITYYTTALCFAVPYRSVLYQHFHY